MLSTLMGAANKFHNVMDLFTFDNSYARELAGAYVAALPGGAPVPVLLWLNRPLAAELGVDAEALSAPHGLAVLAGNRLPAGAQPLAQAYAGHQFGGFSPQLGDGRALLLGEVIDTSGQRRDIAFKGSGPTAFSRGGDGKAALGPVLREVLIGEAMHALGIASTRALAAVATGEWVYRPQALPGAMLVRVAASHLRVGTLQYFAARGDTESLRRVADYAIARHYPELIGQPDRHAGLIVAVAGRQAALIARWMGVGFIHGVMNTDNMTLSGETIDYGPCAFLESYDPATVFSSIDQGGRYAYGNQPGVAGWNLTRFAEALLPLLGADARRAVAVATKALQSYAAQYSRQHLAVFRAKLGLDDAAPQSDDNALIDDFLALLQQHRVDFTLAFRHLLADAQGNPMPLASLLAGADTALTDWRARWQQRRGLVDARTLTAMRHANPAYIPRNQQVEAALEAAVSGADFAPFERLLAVVQQPFDERAEWAAFASPASIEQAACYQTFCGT